MPIEPPPPQDLSPGAVAVITAEFNYIAQTAFQANEDRARASQYFLITFGTVIAALYSSERGIAGLQAGDTPRVFASLVTAMMLGLFYVLPLRRAGAASAREPEVGSTGPL